VFQQREPTILWSAGNIEDFDPSRRCAPARMLDSVYSPG
jgi:hypothetical protein